jgi:hypothetical protein
MRRNVSWQLSKAPRVLREVVAPQRLILPALKVGLDEPKTKAFYGDGLIENDPDPLFTFPRSPPTGPVTRMENGLDRKVRIF